MSIFIVDYMILFPKFKEKFDDLELPMLFAIGVYEDAIRGGNKYTHLKANHNTNGPAFVARRSVFDMSNTQI